MNVNTLEGKIMLSELQEKVDLLTVLLEAANRFNAGNRKDIDYDLKRAKKRLAEAEASK